MKKPKVVLKNVTQFQGREGNGGNADIWINGVKCLFMRDAADGGEIDYDYFSRDQKVIDNVQALDDYIKSLPEKKWIAGSGKELTLTMDRDLFIMDILEAKESEKFNKKRERCYKDSIVFGKKDVYGKNNSYQRVQFKRPLSEIPHLILQQQVDKCKKQYFKEGDVILNTNLKELNIRI